MSTESQPIFLQTQNGDTLRKEILEYQEWLKNKGSHYPKLGKFYREMIAKRENHLQQITLELIEQVVFDLNIDSFIEAENDEQTIVTTLLHYILEQTGEELTEDELYKEILLFMDPNSATDHELLDDVRIGVMSYLANLGIWIEADWIVDSFKITD